MKILVSGSTGFIGSHLCRKLLELGHEVRAFHRPDSPLLLIDGLSVESAIGDITQLTLRAKACYIRAYGYRHRPSLLARAKAAFAPVAHEEVGRM